MSVTGKAAVLAEAMSDISEDCWCAGWMGDCEYDLWRMLQGGDREWGMGEVSEDDIDRLRHLSAECGGWIYWARGLGGCETFAPLEEWLIMFERHEQRNRARAKHDATTGGDTSPQVDQNATLRTRESEATAGSVTSAADDLGHQQHVPGKVCDERSRDGE